jgi:hypothetical protein
MSRQLGGIFLESAGPFPEATVHKITEMSRTLAELSRQIRQPP